MKTYGFITVRVGSSRFWGKCLLPFGKGTVLEHVIRRARFYGFEPVICTTVLKEDDDVVEIGKKHRCPVYRGSDLDVLERWLGTCDSLKVDVFHYIGADDVFFDGELGQRQLQLIRQGFDIVYPPTNTYVGSCAFSMTREVIEKACRIKDSDDTETFWPYVERVPNVKMTELAVSDTRIANFRLTLDYEEDYWLCLTVLRLLGPNVGRSELETLFILNPALREINWFRNEEFRKRQQEKEREIREK